MNKIIFTLFIILGFNNYAQTRISGKVIDTNNIPLIGAAVYLNNTSIGTTTDDLGEFELYIKEGIYDLIVSYLCYETIKYQIDTCLLYTSPSPRDRTRSRMPSSA